jgi:hypothetical protein
MRWKRISLSYVDSMRHVCEAHGFGSLLGYDLESLGHIIDRACIVRGLLTVETSPQNEEINTEK